MSPAPQLMGVLPDQGRRTQAWVAIFKAPGRAWHVKLPLDATAVPKDEAMAYAAAHPPEAF